MANYTEHLEKLIFEVYGAEEGAREIDKIREAEEKHAKSIKGLRKEAKKRAQEEKANARAEQQAAKDRSAALEKIKSGYLGVAAGIGVVVAAGAELVSTYARVNAQEGKLRFALSKTADMGNNVGEAMKEANAQLREWEKFGSSVEEQQKAFTLLVNESRNYQQSIADLRAAHDIAAVSGWDLERSAEALRKARQGEVEVLKELGVLTKEEAEDLAKVEDEATKSAEAVRLLTKHFKGGAEGTQGLDDALKSTSAKLETTKSILGEILVELGDDTAGLISSFAQFTGIIEEGEHPVDKLNKGLENLLGHAKNGDWEKLAGALLLTNPATIPAGMALLGISATDSSIAADNKNFGSFQDRARARGRQQLQAEADDAASWGFQGPMQNGAKGPKGKKKAADDGDWLSDIVANAQGEADEQVLDKAREADERALNLAKARHERKLQLIEDEKKAALEAIKEEDAARKAQDKLDAEMAARRKQRSKETADAVMGGVETLSNSFVKGEGTKAGISGAIEAARAIAAYAAGNIPGGIGHTAASVAFFKVAADAGKSGGRSASPAAAVSSGGSASAAERESVALAGPQGRQSFGRNESYVININSAFPPSQEQARNLADAIDRERRNRS